jgi:hypothetical protein
MVTSAASQNGSSAWPRGGQADECHLSRYLPCGSAGAGSADPVSAPADGFLCSVAALNNVRNGVALLADLLAIVLSGSLSIIRLDHRQ